MEPKKVTTKKFYSRSGIIWCISVIFNCKLHYLLRKKEIGESNMAMAKFPPKDHLFDLRIEIVTS